MRIFTDGTALGTRDIAEVSKPRSEAYLRFSVPAGAARPATLRLWVLDGTNDGPRVRHYGGVLDESGVTWGNRATPLVGESTQAAYDDAVAWIVERRSD